jgi:hypothetical protein
VILETGVECRPNLRQKGMVFRIDFSCVFPGHLEIGLLLLLILNGGLLPVKHGHHSE